MKKLVSIRISTDAQKSLKKCPQYIVVKLYTWVAAVKESGLEHVRRISGYHDEPLKGDRKGQRSIRLNNAYRAIYVVTEDGEIQLVDILEVHKHAY